MTREEVLSEIDRADAMLVDLLAHHPGDRLPAHAQQELAGLRTQVAAQWPLPRLGASQVSIGRFAVRAFDDGPYPELVTRLVRIDALARS